MLPICWEAAQSCSKEIKDIAIISLVSTFFVGYPFVSTFTNVAQCTLIHLNDLYLPLVLVGPEKDVLCFLLAQKLLPHHDWRQRLKTILTN